MSTWINRCLAALCLLALTACDLAGLGGTTRIALFDGALIVAAPNGYCIDTGATRLTGETAVVLIGRCAASSSVAAALLTISVGKPGSAGVLIEGGDRLATFFGTASGRAMLSRTGKADDLAIVRVQNSNGAFVMELNDRILGHYWRGVTGIGSRLISVSATGTEGVPLNPDDGRRLLNSSLMALTTANP